jgi:RimJ/RimL family protein N-acetyltransferase
VSSVRIPQKLGFVEEATLRRRLLPFGTQTEPHDVTVFSLFRDRVAETRCAAAAVKAYDAGGIRVL